MTNADLLEQWYDAMRMIGLSPATIRRRQLTLTRFTKLGHDLDGCPPATIQRWLAGLTVSPTSRTLYLGDISAFYVWALKHDLILVNPCLKVDRAKRPKYEPRPIPTNQLHAAIDAASPRIRVMLVLAGFGGLRAAEIAGLCCEDIDHVGEVIRVKGKGGKVRIIPLHNLVAELVEPGSTGPVVQWRGKAITPGAVSNALARYLKPLTRSTGHQARHSFGTQMYADCSDILAVQKTMGHASPNTTQGYVQFSEEVAAKAVKGMAGPKPLKRRDEEAA